MSDYDNAIRRLRCPACGHSGSIFVADGGYLTCGVAECPNPDFAESVDFETTAKREAEAARDKYAKILDALITSMNDDGDLYGLLRLTRVTKELTENDR